MSKKASQFPTSPDQLAPASVLEHRECIDASSPAVKRCAATSYLADCAANPPRLGQASESSSTMTATPRTRSRRGEPPRSAGGVRPGGDIGGGGHLRCPGIALRLELIACVYLRSEACSKLARPLAQASDLLRRVLGTRNDRRW